MEIQMKWNGMVSRPGVSHINITLTRENTHQAARSSRLAGSRREGSPGNEAVSGIAHGLDAIGGELGPEPADVDLQHVARRVERVAPDVGEQFLPAAHLPRPLHQVV